MEKKKDQNFWDHYKYFIVIFVVLIVLIISACCYSSISNYFFIENPKGEFLKVLITIIGGSAVFIGLMLNNDRIKAQTEQNSISEKGNFDKLFSDAIGYLGSDNTSIVLGGIYALYQLAAKDLTYKPIVAGLFTSYLREKSKGLYDKQEFENLNGVNLIDDGYVRFETVPVEVKTLIDLLFSENYVFYGVDLDLSNTYLKDLSFKGNIENCSFESSYLFRCNFDSDIFESNFNNSVIDSSSFGGIGSIIFNCSFVSSELTNVDFTGNKMSYSDFTNSYLDYTSFYLDHLNNCDFKKSQVKNKVDFYSCKSFKNVSYNSSNKSNTFFHNCENENTIEYINSAL